MIINWFDRTLSNPQIVVLFFILLLGGIAIGFASEILAPLLISLIVAYLLDGLITLLISFRLSKAIALTLVYTLFISALIFFLVIMLPTMTVQIGNFLQDFPAIVEQGKSVLMQLPQMYPQLIEERQIIEFIDSLRSEISVVIQTILSTVFNSIGGAITILVYLVLVPLLVFFFLKDKELLLKWGSDILPRKENRDLTLQVWKEVNQKISSYVRGKLVEIVIVWVVSWIVFETLDLRYAPLLSFLVGVSVIIPYLGAALVTLPIVMVAYAQWGLTNEFLYVLGAYAIIQFLDGNILVPLLFSEVINIHPVAIISSILIFGGLWGIWGVFFAIPLATLVNAVMRAWLPYLRQGA